MPAEHENPARLVIDDEALLPEPGPWLPTAQQIASALAILALASPAMLGGMPVLPVTIEDERRRHMDEIQQISESTVGVHQDVSAAEASLALSQRRLAAATREVEQTHARVVSEADVVHAAKRVMAGEVSPHQQRNFRNALGRVANDSVDLYILLDDEAAQREAEAAEQQLGAYDEEMDDEAWLREWE